MRDAFQRGLYEELQKLASEDLEKKAFVNALIPAATRLLLRIGGRAAVRGAAGLGRAAAQGAAMQAGGGLLSRGMSAVSNVRKKLFGGFGYQSGRPESPSMPNVSPLGTPTQTIRPPAPAV